MEIMELLEALKITIDKQDTSRNEIISSIEDVLTWLVENNTDENCRMVDNYIAINIEHTQRMKLPEDIQEIIFDMGGALHDTHTSPEVAKNFASTPEQLLYRLLEIKSENTATE